MGVSHSKDEDLPEHRRTASIRLPNLLKKSDDIGAVSRTTRGGSSKMSRTITATRAGSSYPYPRGHSTVLVPVGVGGAATKSGAVATAPGAPPSGIRAPTVINKRQQTFDRRSKALNIPSPVPSGSEPSTADNSTNVSRSETREFVEEPFKKIDEEKHPLNDAVFAEALLNLQESNNNNITDNAVASNIESIPCDPSSSIAAPPVERSSPMKTVLFTNSKNVLVTEKPSSVLLSKSLPNAPRSILKTQSMDMKDVSAVQQPKVVMPNTSTSATNIARPTSLLRNVRNNNAIALATADSSSTATASVGGALKVKNSKSTPANLKEGFAPLAESECFVVENSPSVETPPSGFPSSKLPGQNKPPLPVSKLATKSSNATSFTKTGQHQTKDINCKLQPSTKSSTTGSTLSVGDKKQTANLSNLAAMPSKSLSYAESRLKNSSNYARTQRLIYGKAADAARTVVEDNILINDPIEDNSLANKSSSQLPDVSQSTDCRHVDERATAENKAHGPTDDLLLIVKKSEALPSVSPVVACTKLAVASINNNSTATNLLTVVNKSTSPCNANVMSPKHEMHDSGVKTSDASTGSSDASNSKVTSPDGSLHRGLIDDEIKDQPDLTVGSQLERQSSDPTLSGNESALNMDRNSSGPVRYRERTRKHSAIDRMTESYDSTISSASVDEDDLMLDYEGSVDLGESVDFADSCYAGSLAGRKSFKGSWRRRSSNVKRASMEVVMDEWNCLVNEVQQKNSTQSQRLRSASDLPTDSPTNCSKIIRPLKPPASLSIDCAGLPSVSVDQHTYRHLIQDVTVLKTLLFRLKRVLQEADTVNPFESSLALKNGLLKAGLDEILNDRTSTEFTKDDLREENVTLRTQVALMRQQLEEKDRMISEQKQRIAELERLQTPVTGVPQQTKISTVKESDKLTNSRRPCDIINGKLISQTELPSSHGNSPTKSVR